MKKYQRAQSPINTPTRAAVILCEPVYFVILAAKRLDDALIFSRSWSKVLDLFIRSHHVQYLGEVRVAAQSHYGY